MVRWGTLDTLIHQNDRDYIFGSGLKILADFEWEIIEKKLKLYFDYRYFYVNTIPDDEIKIKYNADIYIHMFDSRLIYRFSDLFGLGVGWPFYLKRESINYEQFSRMIQLTGGELKLYGTLNL